MNASVQIQLHLVQTAACQMKKKKKKESSDELMQNGALVTINMNCAIYSVFFFFLIEEHFSALLSVAFPTSAFKNV